MSYIREKCLTWIRMGSKGFIWYTRRDGEGRVEDEMLLISCLSEYISLPTEAYYFCVSSNVEQSP